MPPWAQQWQEEELEQDEEEEQQLELQSQDQSLMDEATEDSFTISTTQSIATRQVLKGVRTPATLHVLVAPVPSTGYIVPLVASIIDTHKQSSRL